MTARAIAVGLGAVLWYFTSGLEPSATAAWLAPVPVFALALRSTWRAALGAAVVARALGGLALWPYLRGVLDVPAALAVGAMVVPALGYALTTVWLRALARRHAPWVAALGTGAMAATIDLLAARLSVHGSFGSIAYTQLTFLPVAQLAALGGTPAIAGAMATVAAALALAVARVGSAAQQRVVWGIAVGVFALVVGAGAARLASSPAAAGSVRVALLATDVPGEPQDAASAAGRAVLARYEQAVQALPAGADEVVVLPERIVDLDAASAQAAVIRWSTLARERQVALVLGVSDGSAPAHNVAWLFSPDGAHATYAKRHLLPPFESRFAAGESITTVALDAARRVGVMICKDADFAEWGRGYANAGIAALLVPAWDFGADGWLHARLAMLRGIEGGYAVVRSARRGHLTVSDAFGRVLVEARSDMAPMALARTSVPVGRVATPYARFGDAFGFACLLAVMALLGAGAVRRP